MSVTPVLILAMGNQLQFQLDVAIGREKKGAQGGMFFFADCHFAIRIAWTYFSTLRDPFIEKFWISKILILGCILYHLYTLIGYLTCCLFSGSRLET